MQEDMITKNFREGNDFVYKFNDAPFDGNGDLNPGLKTPTFAQFLSRLVDQPKIIQDANVITMTALQHNLDMLTNEVDFESQRSSGNTQPYSAFTDIAPGRSAKQLIAVPLVLKSIITDNFLEENIEGQGFLSTWMNYLADLSAPALERFCIFADTTSTETVASGLKANDGILKQALAINGGAQAKTTGIGKLVYKNKIGEGILDNIIRFIDNDARLGDAKLYLPSPIFSRFMAEVAQSRETDLGDAIWTDGTTTKVMGVAIEEDRVLNKSANGFDELGFTAQGEYDYDAVSKTDKMLYGLLTQPSNVVFGMMDDVSVQEEKSLDVLGYKTAILCKADCKLLFEQDSMFVPFTLNNSA